MNPRAALHTLRRFTALALLSTLTLASLPAHAQDAAAERRAEYLKAHAAIDARDFVEARRILVDLWGKSHTYDVAATLGEVEYQLKHYAASARYSAFALANVAPKEGPAAVEGLRTDLGLVRTLVGTVHISVNRPGADVRVDSESVEVSPLPSKVFVDAGERTITARLNSEEVATKLNAKRGEAYTVDLEFKGTGTGTAVSAPDQGAASPSVPDEKSIVPVVAGAAVAVIAVGIGIGFAVAAGSDNDKRMQLAAQHGTVGCSAPGSPLPDCAEQRMAASDYRTHRDISTAGFVVGAAAAAGAAVYWFWPRDTTARSSSGWTRTLRVGGAVVKDAGVVSLTGQF